MPVTSKEKKTGAAADIAVQQPKTDTLVINSEMVRQLLGRWGKNAPDCLVNALVEKDMSLEEKRKLVANITKALDEISLLDYQTEKRELWKWLGIYGDPFSVFIAQIRHSPTLLEAFIRQPAEFAELAKAAPLVFLFLGGTSTVDFSIPNTGSGFRWKEGVPNLFEDTLALELFNKKPYAVIEIARAASEVWADTLFRIDEYEKSIGRPTRHSSFIPFIMKDLGATYIFHALAPLRDEKYVNMLLGEEGDTYAKVFSKIILDTGQKHGACWLGGDAWHVISDKGERVMHGGGSPLILPSYKSEKIQKYYEEIKAR